VLCVCAWKQLLQELQGARAYSRLHYRYGPNFVANSNTTRSIHVGSDRAVIVVDFVDLDELHPTQTRPGDLLRDSTLVYVRPSVSVRTSLDPGHDHLLTFAP